MNPSDPEPLAALAGDVGYPGVRVFRTWVQGALGWQRACFGCPPAAMVERVVMLRGLETHLLVSTPGGRTRVRTWIAERRASPTPPLSVAQRREWIHEHVVAFGDDSMLPAVLRGLGRLPAFVSEAAVRECAFFLTGGRLRGSCGGLAPADRAVVQIAGGPDVEETTMHESAHAFLGPLPRERSEMVSLVGRARVMELARSERWPAVELSAQRTAREERIVQALEQIWSARR